MKPIRPHDGSGATAVFGLKPRQLQPVIEMVAGEPVTSFEVSVEHSIEAEHYGFAGDKVIPTFTYVTASGHEAEATLFVKRLKATEGREARHYQAWAAAGLPVPVLHGVLEPAQREILFLEYVDAVPDYRPYERFVFDEEKFLQFLAVTAHLDATTPPADYAASLPVWSPPEMFGRSVEDCMNRAEQCWTSAREGQLGDALEQFCASHDPAPLGTLAERLIAHPFPPPTCLAHDCYEPCHTGWCRGTGEMLIFDLQDISYGPRFANVSPWLGAPDDVEPLCRPRRELAEYYLAEYARHGGVAVSAEQLLAETRWQWLCEAICLVSRWAHRIVTGQPVREGQLLRLLQFLLREAGGVTSAAATLDTVELTQPTSMAETR